MCQSIDSEIKERHPSIIIWAAVMSWGKNILLPICKKFSLTSSNLCLHVDLTHAPSSPPKGLPRPSKYGSNNLWKKGSKVNKPVSEAAKEKSQLEAKQNQESLTVFEAEGLLIVISSPQSNGLPPNASDSEPNDNVDDRNKESVAPPFGQGHVVSTVKDGRRPNAIVGKAAHEVREEG